MVNLDASFGRIIFIFVMYSAEVNSAPFSHCPSKAFLFQGNPVSSYGVNLVTGDYSLIEDNPGVDANVNGLGFDEQDRYLYGFNTTHFKMVRLGSDFKVETINLSGLPAETTFYVGDVAEHTYYLYRNKVGFYKVDLSPLDADVSANLTAQLITETAEIKLTDFAFHPKDKKLYGVDNKTGVLYQFDPNNGNATEIGGTGETGTFGAVYFDVNGYFYLSRNQDGQIYRINLSSVSTSSTIADLKNIDIAAIKFADGPSSNQNDGARCASAPLINTDLPPTIDFGDAPKSYGTTLADNGPRHLLDGETYLGLTPPDGDYDGYIDANSDDSTVIHEGSYDDEDGVNFVTALEAGLDSVISVYASKNGFLSAWFDWNQDGDFDDEGEQGIIDVALTTGFNNLALRVPASAVLGGSWSRFRFSQQTGLNHSGGSSSGEVEDYPISISMPDISYRYYPGESSWITLAYEDQWPLNDDYDMNDVVMRYRTVEVIRDNKVIRVDIFGELQALGADYHNGFAVQLINIPRENVHSSAVRLLHNNVKQNYSGVNGANTYEIIEEGTSNAVVLVSQDLWKHVSSICTYFRSERGCAQPTMFSFEVSVPFILPVAINEMPAAPYDPFIFATPDLYHGDFLNHHPGRELEIHLADQPPTEKFNFSYFGLADDTSNPTIGRYFRNSNNLPWVLEIVDQWAWPSERKTILQAYPMFQEFIESNGQAKTDWFDLSKSAGQHLFNDM